MTDNSQRASSLVIYATVFVVAVWAGRMGLRQVYEPGHVLRLAATAVLIAGFALLVAAEVHLIRRLDEFQRHVQLLALAIGFGCSFVAVMGIGFLHTEGMFRGAEPRDLGGVMVVFYLIGQVVARYRYR